MLIDCLIYISLLALVLGLAFASFFRTLEHSTQLDRNVADIVRALQTGERWRADVRAATGLLSVDRSPEATTVRIPRAQGQVAYVFREGAVFREEKPGGGPVQVLPNVAASEFQRERRRHFTVWQWELEVRGKQKVTRMKPLFTFQAVAPAEAQP